MRTVLAAALAAVARRRRRRRRSRTWRSRRNSRRSRWTSAITAPRARTQPGGHHDQPVVHRRRTRSAAGGFPRQGTGRAAAELCRSCRSSATSTRRARCSYDLHFARQRPEAEGGRMIFLMTDRYIGGWEAANRPRTIDYPFTLIQLQRGQGRQRRGQGLDLHQDHRGQGRHDRAGELRQPAGHAEPGQEGPVVRPRISVSSMSIATRLWPPSGTMMSA